VYKVFRMSGSGFPTENTEKKTPAEDTEEKIMFIKDCSINFIPENLWKVTYICNPEHLLVIAAVPRKRTAEKRTAAGLILSGFLCRQ